MKDKILKSLLTNIVLMNMLPLNAFAVNNVDLVYDVAEEEGSAIFHLDTSAMNFTNDALTKDIDYHITVNKGNYYADNIGVKASPYLIEATESELVGEHNKENKVSVSFDYTNSKEIIDLTQDATEENTPYRGALQASITKVEKADSYMGKTTILFNKALNIADGNYTEGPFTYSIKNNEATITKYNVNEGGTDVIIPRRTNLGAPVTKIGGSAFSNNNRLTSVVIPNSVTSIGSSAFINNSLTSIEIPNSVTSIGASAFYGNKLTSVEIPDSVTSIGAQAFAYNQLESVVIPNSVTSIGAKAFNSNRLPDDQAFIYARNSDGSEDKSKIVSYGGAKRDNVIIPESVTSIGDSAFSNNSLTSVVIPNSVTSIEYGAFSINRLTNVEIPNSVTSIGNYAFYGNKLTSVEIPDSVTSIGAQAFENNSLTGVEIPNSVTKIGNYAFMNNDLISVEIPNSVISIGSHAFDGNDLISVVIPDSVTKIGNYAFINNSLTSVEIPNSVTSLDSTAFDSGVTITRK